MTNILKRVVDSGWFFAILSLAIGGCASLGTYNPATGRTELIFISTPEEIIMGQDVHQQISNQFKIIEKSDETGRVREIGQRVAKESDRQDYAYSFFLLENEELNAFTTPGGRVYMNSGLVKALRTDDQIASVLAHEIGHCAARHTVKKYQAALGYDLIGGLVLNRMGANYARQITSMSSNVIMGLVFSAYSRKDEYEADLLGLKYLRAAGYDPHASIEVLETLGREAKGAEGPLILRSHPYLRDRISTIQQILAQEQGVVDGPDS